MKILVIGSKGQLGTEIMNCARLQETRLGKFLKELKGSGFVGVDIDEIDITDRRRISEFISGSGFDAVINCAAMTNVDACESQEDKAFAANALGPRNLALACEKIGAKLIHVSTDYVFAGNNSVPYKEWDRPDPRSIYGKSKLLGEEYVQRFCTKHFVVRTAWLYGLCGSNFVKTIVKAAKETGKLKVVNDQRGTPTNAADLAHHLLKLLSTEEYGIYHGTGNGECTWYDFAVKIVEYAGIKAEVSPCTTEEFVRPAKRPAYSILDNMMFRNTVGDEFRDWDDALKDFMSTALRSGAI
jgi:dTDP-4-dehydrorhamnose reductase